MGFYGNIGNTTTSSFTFDKIYPNRQRMDGNASSDGVFIGRYVLIEYDMDDKTFYTQLYINTYFYIDEECQNEVDISNINDGQIVFTEENGIKTYYQVKIEDSNLSFIQMENISDDNIDKQVYKKIVFYHDVQCTEVVNASDVNDGEIIYTMENDIAVFYKVKKEEIGEENNIPIYKLSFIKVIEEQTDSYLHNYLIDKDSYSTSDGSFGRGYDSTVWQKVFTNNEEKYVLIAELNSVVPTFDLTIDAPTINPVVPHFDADSSNVYYKLHVQPNWGFRVKEAENGLSDFNVSYRNSLNAPANASSDYIGTKSNYAGAIYINKAGFDVNESNHVDIENIKNEITLTPTGQSGAQYNDHNITNPSQTSVQNDIQELSIILPSIGNTVATLWDIAYGEERNQDISWDSTQGLRLVKENFEDNGFTYSTGDVETIAGCINSVHDLMGMIVESQIIDKDAENKVDVHDVDSDKIYYDSAGKKYYIKEKSYKWDSNKKAEPTDDEYFIPEYNEVDLINYYPETYYTKNANGDFIFSMSDNAVDGVNYYEIEATQHTLSKWNANNYYYQDEDNNYKLDTQDRYTQDRIYYSKYDFLRSAVEKCSYFFSDDFKHINTGTVSAKGDPLYYGPFYVVQENGVKKCYPRGKDINGEDFGNEKVNNLPNALIKYSISWGLDIDGNEGYIYTINEETLIDGFKEYSSSEKYYTQDENGNYILLMEGIPNDYYNQIYNKSNPTYYTINTNDIDHISGDDNVFFNPETVYHENIDNNYIRIISDNLISGKEYYSVDIKNTYNIFYKSNKYYYKIDDVYQLDDNPTITDERQYYELLEPYIGPDYSGTVYALGAKINTEIKLSDYPENERQSIKEHAYYRQDDWAFKELPGFARTLNTIHGLILRINNLIKFDDELTRDLSTVQGCINKLNDIIHTIGALKPNHFIAVDEAGYMVSMQPLGDNWINVAVNMEGDGRDKVKITHKDPDENDIVSARNENDLTPKFGDSFTIEDWAFDEKGHRVENKSKSHTITIPKGSLNDLIETGSSVLTGISMDDEAGAITQTNANVGTLILAQYEQGTSGNLTISDTNTINSAFKTIQTYINELDYDDENSGDAYFISKITQKDGKINAVERAAAGSLRLVDENGSYSKSESASDITNNDTIQSAFGKVEAQIVKEAQNRQGAIEAAIANLDYNPIGLSDSTVITEISQTNGTIAVNSKQIGELKLTGWTLEGNNGTITNTDTVNSAFAKAQNQINANKSAIDILNGNKNTVGSVAYQIAQILNDNDSTDIDTLEEIAAWISSDPNGVAALNKNIVDLQNNVSGLKALVGEKSISAQISENAIQSVSLEAGTTYGTLKLTVDGVIGAEVAIPGVVTSDATFVYPASVDHGIITQNLTISDLVNYIAGLEKRIYTLEHPVTEAPAE